jgi:hypothetical protein
MFLLTRGNPTPEGTPGIVWPDTDSRSLTLRLDVEPNLVVIADLRSELCDFWDEMGPLMQTRQPLRL